MHWEVLPKVIHNPDAVREYERQESRRIGRHIRRILLIAVPIVLILAIGFFLR